MELTAFEQAHPAALPEEALQEAITQASDPTTLADIQAELAQVQAELKALS